MKNDMADVRYLQVSDAAMRLGFQILGVGHQFNIAPQRGTEPDHPTMYHMGWNRGRVLPEYQLIYIIAGSGEFESRQTGLCKLAAGTILLLLPDVWHRYRHDTQIGLEQYWISFNGTIPHQLQSLGIIGPESALRKPADAALIHHEYQRLLETVVHQPGLSPVAASLAGLSLFSRVLESTITADSDPDRRTVDHGYPRDPEVCAALEIIWSRSHRALSVKTLAGQLGITRRTLERKFAATRGHGVLQEITACRLQRARRMLTETQLPIKYISHCVGFASPLHITSVFRRELNVTPSEYRRQSAISQ